MHRAGGKKRLQRRTPSSIIRPAGLGACRAHPRLPSARVPALQSRPEVRSAAAQTDSGTASDPAELPPYRTVQTEHSSGYFRPKSALRSRRTGLPVVAVLSGRTAAATAAIVPAVSSDSHGWQPRSAGARTKSVASDGGRMRAQPTVMISSSSDLAQTAPKTPGPPVCRLKWRLKSKYQSRLARIWSTVAMTDRFQNGFKALCLTSYH